MSGLIVHLDYRDDIFIYHVRMLHACSKAAIALLQTVARRRNSRNQRTGRENGAARTSNRHGQVST